MSHLGKVATYVWGPFRSARAAIDALWHRYLDAALPEVANVEAWHKHIAPWPVRTIEGEHHNIVWRRLKPDGTWEYACRQESIDDLADRM